MQKQGNDFANCGNDGNFASSMEKMVTILFHETVFGPIHSRRLGTSLGINLMPNDGKICSFDCLYCEAGYNDQGAGHAGISSREEVKDTLEKKLSAMKAAGLGLDVITFSGNGESKLDGLAVYKFNEDIIPSMNGWHCAKACYPQQGAVKLGGSKNGEKHFLVTPPISGINENTAVTISCRAGAAHASSTPALLNIKIFRVATQTVETVKSIDLPASAYVMSPNNDGYHNVVDMKSYSADAVLQPGDYVLIGAEKTSETNRLILDDILIVKK